MNTNNRSTWIRKLLPKFGDSLAHRYRTSSQTTYPYYTLNKLDHFILERKPLKGLIKKYKTPPQRRRKKKEDGGNENDEEDEEDDDESEGERTALNHRYQHSDSHNSFTLQPNKVNGLVARNMHRLISV